MLDDVKELRVGRREWRVERVGRGLAAGRRGAHGGREAPRGRRWRRCLAARETDPADHFAESNRATSLLLPSETKGGAICIGTLRSPKYGVLAVGKACPALPRTPSFPFTRRPSRPSRPLVAQGEEAGASRARTCARAGAPRAGASAPAQRRALAARATGRRAALPPPRSRRALSAPGYTGRCYRQARRLGGLYGRPCRVATTGTRAVSACGHARDTSATPACRGTTVRAGGRTDPTERCIGCV